jgi:hypothetical protein
MYAVIARPDWKPRDGRIVDCKIPTFVEELTILPERMDDG